VSAGQGAIPQSGANSLAMGSGTRGRRFKSCQPDECDVSGHRGRPNPIVVGSAVLCLAGGAWWASGALVALGCVEDQLAEEFAGGGVEDADVEVLDQDDDAGSGVGSADADG
jgi:hypothetical protein